MTRLRYDLRSDWLFYLLVLSYAFLIVNMTAQLWFGGGINIFASYSDAATLDAVVLDANKIYWSKTCFLFGALLLIACNVDIRAAYGAAAMFWAGSLALSFAATPPMIFTFILGGALVLRQIMRKQLLSSARAA